jgi:hypothetical protein
MPQRRTTILAAVLAALALPGCTAGAFACVDDASCSGGVCQGSGYCSFADADCGSGQRYGEHAPAELAGACVVPGSESSGTSSVGTSTSVEPITTLEGTAPGEASATGEASASDDSSSGAATTDPAATMTSPSETSMTTGDSTTSGGPDPADCVVEEFDDDTLDGWYLWADDGVTSGVSGGQLHLGFAAEPNNTGLGRDTVGIAGRVFDVEVVAGPQAASHAQLSITVSRPDDVAHMLVLETGTLAMLRWDGMNSDVQAAVDVGDAPPRYWRVVATDASLTWQYAFEPDQFVDFAVEKVQGVTEMSIAVIANTWQPEMAPGEAILERVSDCPGA